MSINPFQPTKFELENNPKIWLNPRAKSLISAKKPSFVYGTRGCGKTTLLRSLHTKEILGNTILREQFGQRRLNWFGAYLQFNHNFQFITEMVLDVLGGKEQDDKLDEIKRYKTFCSYFEISLLESVVSDLLALEDSGVLHFSGQKERKACSEISALFGKISTKEAQVVYDYGDLKRLLRSLRASFTAIFDLEKIEAVKSVVDSFIPGTLLRIIREDILGSVHCRALEHGAKLGFVVLLDDCESLSKSQQVALNTYLKSNEGVSRWIIAHVRGQYNTSETFLPETYLNYADRDVAAIDELTDSEFSSFCENVATLRMRTFLEDHSPKEARSDDQMTMEIFGKPSYNTLISAAIGGYPSKLVTDFKNNVEAYKNYATNNIKKEDWPRFSMDDGKLPYVEYVVAKIGNVPIAELAVEASSIERLKKRIFRKEAAAYVYACHLCNRTPIYAGGRFVLWASDGNIRDFLDIMAEFFDQYALKNGATSRPLKAAVKTIRRFFNSSSNLDLAIQNEVLLRVSGRSLVSIEDLQHTSEKYLYRLMFGLSKYVQLLQTDTSDNKAILQPERGVFRVSGSAVDSLSKQPNFEKTVRRLERDGFLVVNKTEDVENESFVEFRLHKRLSPALGISPKGAYETVLLRPVGIARLLDDRFATDPNTWARNEHEHVSSVDARQQKFEM
ncbi:hypothetical protein [Citreimonas salinaria]|uniref:Uncharacterized protein n=1 Tax=Citreimonas salinaria TaxID=321339 RepID=A0A1H3LMS3_9RHOB|nr:hypothetical protein [Citreimonas salinaria]SDY65610.1 hypothetical protein SAMN05444340_113103 [Citreimonas salinaria]